MFLEDGFELHALDEVIEDRQSTDGPRAQGEGGPLGSNPLYKSAWEEGARLARAATAAGTEGDLDGWRASLDRLGASLGDASPRQRHEHDWQNKSRQHTRAR